MMALRGVYALRGKPLFFWRTMNDLCSDGVRASFIKYCI